MSNPFRYFNSSPDVIRLVVMMYVRYPLSLRNVEDLLAERGIVPAQADAFGGLDKSIQRMLSSAVKSCDVIKC